jgi:oligoribonuclease
MPQNSRNLIWIDLEMTGLNPSSDVILEIATLVTDADLHVLAEGPELVIHQSRAFLDGMDEWNQTHHGESGLIERVLASTISVAEAEAQTLAFLSDWVPKGVSPICGNSICQDRRFLAQGMPALEKYFHYRNLDVSTLKELALRWAPDIAAGVVKAGRHRALDDIRESIEELRYYRQHLLKI